MEEEKEDKKKKENETLSKDKGTLFWFKAVWGEAKKSRGNDLRKENTKSGIEATGVSEIGSGGGRGYTATKFQKKTTCFFGGLPCEEEQ